MLRGEEINGSKRSSRQWGSMTKAEKNEKMMSSGRNGSPRWPEMEDLVSYGSHGIKRHLAHPSLREASSGCASDARGKE